MPFWFLCSTLCFSGLPSSTFLPRAALAPRSSPHGAAARHCRLDNTPSVPTGQRAGALQPKVHLPQRDHGRGLVLPDTRGAQSRGGRPRCARGAEILSSSAPRLSPRAQATPRRITRTSSSTATTRTAWCTASEARLPALSPLGLTCVCDPHRPREDSSGNYGGLRRVRPRTQASAVRH